MISTLAVANYRSLRNLIAPIGALNLVSGDNGALRVLAAAAHSDLIASLAREGVRLAKNMGETLIVGQGPIDAPSWEWPGR